MDIIDITLANYRRFTRGHRIFPMLSSLKPRAFGAKQGSPREVTMS